MLLFCFVCRLVSFWIVLGVDVCVCVVCVAFENRNVHFPTNEWLIDCCREWLLCVSVGWVIPIPFHFLKKKHTHVVFVLICIR